MGKYHCTIDLLFDWLGISCMTTDNFWFYLQNRLIQTSQTVGQWYRDPPLVFPGNTRKTDCLLVIVIVFATLKRLILYGVASYNCFTMA